MPLLRMPLPKKVLGPALALGTATLMIGSVACLNSSPSGAAAPPRTGTGYYNCGAITGTVKFEPPLTSSGGQSETATIKVHARNCMGGTPQVGRVAVSGTVTASSNAVSGLLDARSLTLVAKYAVQPRIIRSTAHTGLDATVEKDGTVTFSVVGAVSGSFVSDSLAGTVSLGQTLQQIDAAAASKKGLVSVSVVAGSLVRG
jgi:hypothetical protein